MENVHWLFCWGMKIGKNTKYSINANEYQILNIEHQQYQNQQTEIYWNF